MIPETPLKAIRSKCVQCKYDVYSVSYCKNTQCPLYYYRFGKKPTRETIAKVNSLGNIISTKPD